jgi:photosystem II stability/assembly factor-like uncharacterized protein
MTDRKLLWFLSALLVLVPAMHVAAFDEEDEEEEDAKLMSASTFAGLKLRSIGPALMSGRISDFAVNPERPNEYFVAVASGGVWKTENAGTTYKPVFDGQASYSIGCVTLDPNNSHVVWVGTGENNSQRSVSWGDGVYRSRDGGAHWENVGLKESEHIGMIAIDPRDSNVLYVAAQGPLWRSGGDRGLYKTTDGGTSWTRVLHVSDDTGINEVHMDPRDPDVLYASSYQRRRHVWTLINGGPESAIYKSTDAGETWRKIKHGLPSVDMGRIGLEVSPAEPDVVYAIIEAADGKGGFFRSQDRGETWSKRSSYMTSSPQYYNEITCDPKNVDRVYAMDTFLGVTEDGGKSFGRVPRTNKHVDNHAMWINPDHTDHVLVGCDGGIYESYDRGEHWEYKANLPITQFYRVSVDDSTPFYYVYGGTQDNSSVGGPSRTISPAGITNDDWFLTVGGDGYETVIDPEDPNIVYSLWQYGGLVRHDRRSGEVVDIKPVEPPGEKPYIWNWDSPLILSPHNHKRLYFAGNMLFRSDDQGHSWTAVSGDLSRGIDRNQLKVMGKLQSVDAVAKNNSTSIYGNCVSLTESALVEGLLYVGTDDGIVHVSGDGGANWRKILVFPTVPDKTYVSCLTASRHHADTVYAAFDNHKNGDFKPYLLKSIDRGETWESIVGDLPEREVVYSIAQDHEKPDLLFAGTEFGLYVTMDGGTQWLRLKGGLPTIAVRDIDVQRRENDLALGTFGRGFYILDDYTPLRTATKETLEQDAHMFPIKPALRYIPTSRLGGRNGKGSQGATYFSADNPPYGAVFTYYIKEKLLTKKETRQKAEKKKGVKEYPTIDEMRAEDEEQEPSIILTVTDDAGQVVRRINGSRDKGIHRASWDLRYPASVPVSLRAVQRSPWDWEPDGPLALPGTYKVTLSKEIDGALTTLVEPQPFEVIPLELATFAAKDRDEVLAFQRKAARLQRAVLGSLRVIGEVDTRLNHVRQAIVDTPGADPALLAETRTLVKRVTAMRTRLAGDRLLSRLDEPTPTSINGRVSIAVANQQVTSPPTQTQRTAYDQAAAEFGPLLTELRKLVTEDLAALEAKLEAAGAPWTPGRLPEWGAE